MAFAFNDDRSRYDLSQNLDQRITKLEHYGCAGNMPVTATSMSDPFICEYDGWIYPTIQVESDSISFVVGNPAEPDQYGPSMLEFTIVYPNRYPVFVKRGMNVFISSMDSHNENVPPTLHYHPFNVGNVQ